MYIVFDRIDIQVEVPPVSITDLDHSPKVQARHVKEAVGYRSLDQSDLGE